MDSGAFGLTAFRENISDSEVEILRSISRVAQRKFPIGIKIGFFSSGVLSVYLQKRKMQDAQYNE
jgi:hypothetical protein